MTVMIPVEEKPKTECCQTCDGSGRIVWDEPVCCRKYTYSGACCCDPERLECEGDCPECNQRTAL